MEIKDALNEAATAVLRRMAERHGLPGARSSTRAEIQQQLSGRLTDPDYLQAQLGALNPGERRALAAARPLRGDVRGFVLSRVLGGDPARLARDLLDQGLLFRRFVAQGAARGEVFTVPDEVLALLPVGPDDPHAVALPPTGAAPGRGEQRASDPSISLFALASVVARFEPSVAAGKSGREMGALREEVQGWTREPGGWEWQGRWALLDHLARGLGWLVEEHGSLALAPRLAQALRQRDRLAQRLWETYLEDRWWSDLDHAGVPHAKVLDEQAPPADLRRDLAQMLALLPVGRWVGLAAIIGWVKEQAPGLLRGRLDARGATLMDPRYQAPLLGADSWDRVEGALLRYVLLGPLYWLGLIVSDAAGERLAVTTRGHALLAGAPLEQPPRAAEPCTWVAPDTLVAPPWVDLGLLLRAESYLTLEERGQTSRYRLEQARVAEALGRGGSVGEARDLLAQLTRSALPDRIADLLREWEEREGAFHLRPAVLLEARSAAQVEGVLADPQAAPLLRGRLGETTLEIAASQALALETVLRKRGELPRVDAALRLLAGRRAYASLVDEEVLELLLVLLWGLEEAQPEHLAQLEGAPALLRRLETLFPPERSRELRRRADQLTADLVRGSGDTRSRSERPRHARQGAPGKAAAKRGSQRA